MALQRDDVTLDQIWSLLETSADGLWLWDVEADRVLWSESLLRSLGYPEGERNVDDIIGLVHPDDREPFHSAIRRQVEGESAVRVEIRLRSYHGEWVAVQAHGISTRGADGAATARVGYLTDVSKLREAEESLRRSERRLRVFLDASPAAAFLKTADSTHLYVNDFAAKLAGVPPEEMLGRRHVEIFPPDIAAALDETDARVRRTGEKQEWMGPISREDGTERWAHDIKFPVELEDGEVGVGGFAFDVTELRRAQVAAETGQRLESIGRLAGGIAHDFNNMLSIILGYSRMVEDELPADSPARAHIAEVISAATHSVDVTRQLLAFARQQAIQPRQLDLIDRVARISRLLERLIGEKVELEVDLPASVAPVRLDPSQLDQVLTNLCLNAKDAIEGDGTITVRLFDAPAMEGGGHSGMEADDVRRRAHVVLSVSDDGSGIPPQHLDGIFEPFFTTKPMGQGTGLGLATVYGIVQQNGGRIEVDSEVGVGTTFTLRFPTGHGEGEGAGAHPDRPAVAERKTVLVVEDEPALLRLNEEMLRRAGYDVYGAVSPDEALEVLDAVDCVDVLVTDVIMPRMNGKELAEVAVQRHPDLRVLFVSGYTDEVISNSGVVDEQVAFLQKPFLRDALVRAIEALVGDAAG